MQPRDDRNSIRHDGEFSVAHASAVASVLTKKFHSMQIDDKIKT